MKKVAIFLSAVAVISLSACNNCAECHAATGIGGTEYELTNIIGISALLCLFNC